MTSLGCSRAGGAVQLGVLQQTSPSWSPAWRWFPCGCTSGSSVWWRPRRGAWHHLSLQLCSDDDLSEVNRTVSHQTKEQEEQEDITRNKTTNRGESPHVIGNISLLHTLRLRTKKVFFVLWSDKDFLSVKLCADAPSNQLRCRGSLQFYTDGEFGWDNAGLCDSKLGLEGCSSWVARLGPHPHAQPKLGARLRCSAGVHLERAHPCVIVQNFIYTSHCQKSTATH